jgi:hypothetical protein
VLESDSAGGQRMNRTAGAVLMVLVLAGAALAQVAKQDADHVQSVSAQENALPTGQLVGTASEIHGGRVPGVEVTVTKAGAATKRTTDADARFVFDGLPPGEYNLTARLAGFKMCAPKAPLVQVRTGHVTSRNILLAPAHIEEVHVMVSTVQSLWDRGVPVVRLRVTGQPRIIPDTCDWLTAYRGAVVEVLKQPIGKEAIGSEVPLVQESCSWCRPPFAEGDEMVAILHRIEDRNYVAFRWSIRNGRVVAADGQTVMQRFIGMRVADFIKELRGLIAESGRH